MKALVMHRALFSVLLCVFGLSVAGCPNLGMHTKIQTFTEEGTIALSQPPNNFLDRAARTGGTLGYQLTDRRAKENMVALEKTPDAAAIAKAVLYGGQDKTKVRLVLSSDNNIRISVDQSGNLGSTDPEAAKNALEAFRTALEKEFGATTLAAQ